MIRVNSLRKSFGDSRALDGLSFSARDGMITGLIGPNGAGKTTALRLIAGLLRADSGKALVDSVNPAENPIGARRRIGALTDGLGNYPRLTAREHIRYFGELRGMSKPDIAARTDALLDLFQMRDLADRRAQGFSQGERMKLALARAMVNDPANVILDEPANGLDVATVRALRKLLEHLRAAGKCILLCSHLMPEVSMICDRVVVIARGKTVAEGSPGELRDLTGACSMREWRAMRFGRWALAVQLAIVMLWFSVDVLRRRMPANSYLFGIALIVMIGAIGLAIFNARERRIRRDLVYLDACGADLVP